VGSMGDVYNGDSLMHGFGFGFGFNREAHVSAPTFNPLLVPDAGRMYTPWDPSSFTDVGGFVSAAVDGSGNSRDLAQTNAAKRPAINAANGSWDFDGTDDALTHAGTYLWDAGAATVMCVYELVTGADADTLASEVGNGYYSFNRMTTSAGTYLPTGQIYINSTSLMSNLSLDNINMLTLGTYIYTQQDTGSVLSCYKNNIAGSSPRSYTRTTTGVLTTFVLGAENNRRYINARIKDYIDFPRVLTDDERNYLITGYAERHGITLA